MNNRLSSLKSLLDKCNRNENLIAQIHAHATTLGVIPVHQHFTCKLLNIYAKKLINPIKAHKTFNQIQTPDIVSWTCLMSIYLQTQHPHKALTLFSKMIVSTRLKPDGHCIVAAISACGLAKNLVVGRIVHGMVLRYELGSQGEEKGPIVCNALIDFYARNGRVEMAKRVFDVMDVKDIASWTSLVNGYVMCGDIESAGQLFDEMPERNVVSWTAMIVGYVRGKDVIRGLKLFREMRNEDRPSTVTIVATLSGCADIGALDFGGSLHGYVNKVADFDSDVSVNNALIDMYCKGGSLKMAQKVFSKMAKKDVFSWTSLISGLALHGEGRSTVKVFDDMVCSGLNPNDVTFLSVLSACGHGGLIKEGRLLFKRMVLYRFKPNIKHYGCMVDLFCRAGHIDEAMELIKGMPLKPDAVIWRSVLSACMIKRELELAEIAAKKVLELEPYDDGVHVLLWNVYRLNNKWEDALKIRKMMRSQNIKKQPGCSWIEINGFVHEFTAENAMHQLATDMQVILEVLGEQSRSIHVS
ncbi:pentatricopeptide repeat-containing protein At2g29760, chloroplastic-like [Rutidosis leptorrhynchoides]|uniref:pentatricopeptide repeat-containing protein At2g29760, chloroplastic-like n=1 Tax=Rutidosis leptorrhynchoides TaxID=125765 RepID=UPI003A99A8FC